MRTLGSAGIVLADAMLEQRLAALLEAEGWVPKRLPDPQSGVSAAEHQTIDVLFMEDRGTESPALQPALRQRLEDSGVPVVLMANAIQVRRVVAAIKEGVSDYLELPVQPLPLHEALTTVRQERRRRNDATDNSGDIRSVVGQMGNSPRVQQLALEIAQLGPTSFSALILGETGTGKELVAQAIHRASPRHARTFLALDCGAIPESLMESELFGHEKGAFTGADRMQIGKLEAAEDGTLFLDEISSLPLSMQNRLLRVLQERTFYRVGGTKPLSMRCRIIAAASNPHLGAFQEGFRKDLYHRLGEYVIHLPPLRERREDIPFLVGLFIRQANAELGKQVVGVSPETLRLLSSHPWPGNVRELRNVIRRGVLWTEDRDFIHPKHMGLEAPDSPLSLCPTPPPQESVLDPELGQPLRELVRVSRIRIETRAIVAWLNRTHGNIAEVARKLDADYKTIHSKIKEYGIELHVRAGSVVATCPTVEVDGMLHTHAAGREVGAH